MNHNFQLTTSKLLIERRLFEVFSQYSHSEFAVVSAYQPQDTENNNTKAFRLLRRDVCVLGLRYAVLEGLGTKRNIQVDENQITITAFLIPNWATIPPGYDTERRSYPRTHFRNEMIQLGQKYHQCAIVWAKYGCAELIKGRIVTERYADFRIGIARMFTKLQTPTHPYTTNPDTPFRLDRMKLPKGVSGWINGWGRSKELHLFLEKNEPDIYIEI